MTNCKPTSTTAPGLEEDQQETTTVPADFRTFYDRFHTDTLYQMDHISFPLAGLPANADTLTSPSFYWKADHWKWHRPIDPDLTGYERQWQVVSDEMVIETIVQTTTGIGMVRRFAKMGNDWSLIYYAGMNPMR